MEETTRSAAAARRRGGGVVALAAAVAGLAGCAPPPPPALAPEAALAGCEAGAFAELRRLDPAVETARLEPLADARVERRALPPGQAGGVGLVIEGRGEAAGGGGTGGSFGYTCLVGTAGPVLFVAVRPRGDGQVMAECAGRPEGPRTCLRGLVAGAEAALARAEAAAVAQGRRRAGEGGGASRAEIDEPAAASIGAWRVYRDAECARRHGGGGAEGGADREAACLVELTRARLAELGA